MIFTSDGKPNNEVDTRIGKVKAVLREPDPSVVKKREFSNDVKLSVFKSVFVPILTYGHESWITSEIVLSQVQPAEMRVLRRVHGVTLRDDVRSCEICKALKVEPLLRIERSQLRLFGYVTSVFPGKIFEKVLLATPTR